MENYKQIIFDMISYSGWEQYDIARLELLQKTLDSFSDKLSFGSLKLLTNLITVSYINHIFSMTGTTSDDHDPDYTQPSSVDNSESSAETDSDETTLDDTDESDEPLILLKPTTRMCPCVVLINCITIVFDHVRNEITPEYDATNFVEQLQSLTSLIDEILEQKQSHMEV